VTTSPDTEKTMLRHFLDAQREVVRTIVAGMDDTALRSTPFPSGWSALGMVEHLAGAERHWFQEVILGTPDEPWWHAGYDVDTDGPFVSSRAVDEVIAIYRRECARSNEILGEVSLDTAPVGHHNRESDDTIDTVRWVVLHMIEETARHAGHLDAARELLDGQVGLAPR
jgi:uncharacterized damage-inducible protein DinB